MDLEQAVRCVKHMLPETARAKDLRGTSSVISSALANIMCSAKFIEQAAANDKRLGSISLGVYAVVRSPSRKEARKPFTLFGPLLETLPNLDESFFERQGCVRGADGLTPDREDSENTEHAGDESQDGNNQTAPDTSVTQPLSGTTMYTIPPEIVAKSMSYLIDISGSTSHLSAFKDKALTPIHGRTISKALQAIFKKHKNNLIQGGVGAHTARYTSLLPSSVLGKEVLLPKIKLIRNRSGGAYSMDGYLKVTTHGVRKVDRNKKVQNLAMLAFILHHREHGIDVEEILNKFAVKAFGIEGCRKFHDCRAEANNSECRDRPRDICELFGDIDGHRETVAKGVADPFSSFIMGMEIPASCMLIGVNTVVNNEVLMRIDRSSGVLNGRAVIWPKAMIGRVGIIGEFDEVIGSSILVLEDVVRPEDVEDEDSDVCNAALLCDVDIKEGRENILHPYTKWYTNPNIRRLRSFLAVKPTLFGEIKQGRGKATLWHKSRIRKIS